MNEGGNVTYDITLKEELSCLVLGARLFSKELLLFAFNLEFIKILEDTDAEIVKHFFIMSIHHWNGVDI